MPDKNQDLLNKAYDEKLTIHIGSLTKQVLNLSSQVEVLNKTLSEKNMEIDLLKKQTESQEVEK